MLSLKVVAFVDALYGVAWVAVPMSQCQGHQQTASVYAPHGQKSSRDVFLSGTAWCWSYDTFVYPGAAEVLIPTVCLNNIDLTQCNNTYLQPLLPSPHSGCPTTDIWFPKEWYPNQINETKHKAHKYAPCWLSGSSHHLEESRHILVSTNSTKLIVFAAGSSFLGQQMTCFSLTGVHP